LFKSTLSSEIRRISLIDKYASAAIALVQEYNQRKKIEENRSSRPCLDIFFSNFCSSAVKMKQPVLAAFLADSFALGGHWCYDIDLLKTKLNPSTLKSQLQPPTLNDYHKDKQAGDYTHYGDQMLWLLDSSKSGFDLSKWQTQWSTHMKTYAGYMYVEIQYKLYLESAFRDHASKETLTHWESSGTWKASESTDIAGASRMIPLLQTPFQDEFKWVQAVQQQTAMTHNSESVVAVSAFFGHLLWRQQSKSSIKPSTLFQEIANHLGNAFVSEKVDAVMKANVSMSLYTFLCQHGEDKVYGNVKVNTAQSCNVVGAFPAVLFAVRKYESGDGKTLLMDALLENLFAGGDSAARGILVAAVLAGMSGVHVPEHLVKQLRHPPQ
jgi:ADP-ribosylglycohydrolase